MLFFRDAVVDQLPIYPYGRFTPFSFRNDLDIYGVQQPNWTNGFLWQKLGGTQVNLGSCEAMIQLLEIRELASALASAQIQSIAQKLDQDLAAHLQKDSSKIQGEIKGGEIKAILILSSLSGKINKLENEISEMKKDVQNVLMFLKKRRFLDASKGSKGIFKPRT